MTAATRSAPARAARLGGVLLAAGAAAVLVAPWRFAPGAAPGGTPGVDGTAGAATAPAAAGAPIATPTAAPPNDGAATADPAADLRLVELRGGWRDREDLATAVALAVLVGTAHVDAADGAGAHVAVEAVEQPGRDAVVVTLLVAPRGPTDADAPRAVRLAVPVRTDSGGVRVAGTPWALPGPRLDPEPLTGVPVTDPALLEAAAAALGRAGFDGAALASLERTEAWPFVARLGDGTGGPEPAAVWLRWHLDRFVVTGLPLQPAAGSGQGTGFP